MAFKLKSGNSPLFKHMGGHSPMKNDDDSETIEFKEKKGGRLKPGEYKTKHRKRGNTRITVVRDPDTKEKIKITEEWDEAMGEWHQIGIPKGEGGEKYSTDIKKEKSKWDMTEEEYKKHQEEVNWMYGHDIRGKPISLAEYRAMKERERKGGRVHSSMGSLWRP